MPKAGKKEKMNPSERNKAKAKLKQAWKARGKSDADADAKAAELDDVSGEEAANVLRSQLRMKH